MFLLGYLLLLGKFFSLHCFYSLSSDNISSHLNEPESTPHKYPYLLFQHVVQSLHQMGVLHITAQILALINHALPLLF